MSSSEVNSETGDCSTNKFSNLIVSCPFTWGMENDVEDQNKFSDGNDDERAQWVTNIQDNFPEFILIYHLMLAYENFMKNDLSGAMQSVCAAEKSFADIRKQGTLKNVENVLQHIFVATKCHVLEKLERIKETDELLDGFCDVDDMNEIELAMLNGCQCLAWSLYYNVDNLKAIEHAEKAIEYEPDNGKWYFLLGKSHRRLRKRYNSKGLRPSPPEISAFKTAFKLTENVLFGVHLAQMYRETWNHQMANEMYKEVYDLQPTCCKIRLQLALGFIHAKQCRLAKNCLDYVAENRSKSKTYHHYMGIYEEKCNRDFKAALFYYERATEDCNSAAEWQYMTCKKKVEPDWDPLPYMLGLLKRYERDSNHVIQAINIRIGAHYLFEKHDILSACPYFTNAIKISPRANLLKDHHLLFHQSESVNIYHALTKEIQFALTNHVGKYDDDEVVVLREALQLCRRNCQDLFSPSAGSQGQTPSSSLSDNHRNYGQGTSSRAGIRVTGDLPDLSSRDFRRGHPQQSRGNARNSPKEWVRRDRKYPAPLGPVRDRGPQRTASAKPRDNDNGEANASCCLVKTLKNLDL